MVFSPSTGLQGLNFSWGMNLGSVGEGSSILVLRCFKTCSSWDPDNAPRDSLASCMLLQNYGVYIAAEGVATELRKCKLISNANTKATVCIKN